MAQFKKGDLVTVTGEDFSYPAKVKRLIREDDEAYYELLDLSCNPPLPVEEYESFITKRQ